jgi:hypothetical protein
LRYQIGELLFRQLERPAGGKALGIALEGFVEPGGGDAEDGGQSLIQDDALTSDFLNVLG